MAYSKVSWGGGLVQSFDGGLIRFQTKNFLNTFTYNITNQAAKLKLSIMYTITILKNLCDSPNRTIVKCRGILAAFGARS